MPRPGTRRVVGGRLTGSAATDFCGTITGGDTFTLTCGVTEPERIVLLEGSMVEKIGKSESEAMASSIVFFLATPQVDRF